MVIANVTNIEALQSLVAKPRDMAVVAGYHRPGDGGGGDFVLDTTVIESVQRHTAQIRSVSAGTPVRVEIVPGSEPHQFINGQAVLISGVDVASVNGSWNISEVQGTTFTLDGSVGTSTGSGGVVDTVRMTASAQHWLVNGQTVTIARSNSALDGAYLLVGVIEPNVFSLPTALTPSGGGNFGDGGRSIPSTAVAGRWIRVQSHLDPRFYGARCDNHTDDSASLQAMIDANPGGRYVLPGGRRLGWDEPSGPLGLDEPNGPVTIYMGRRSLVMKGWGWTLDGGGATFKSGNVGGTTLRWDAGVPGIVALNSLGAGMIRDLSLVGGEPFAARLRAAWPDAILPDFTDRLGRNIFHRRIKEMSRTDSVVTAHVTDVDTTPDGHTYVVGTQITISDVPEHPELEGVYYITAVGKDSVGRFSWFSYLDPRTPLGEPPADLAVFQPANAVSSITTGSGSRADAIVAGSNYLRIENVNIQGWGRFGIHAMGEENSDYWADDVAIRNVTIINCRGVGLYMVGGNANACDITQVNADQNLVGGIYDSGFLGNTHIAEQVSICGCEYGSMPGPARPVASIACGANVLTVTTDVEHEFAIGQAIVLESLSDASYQSPPGSAMFVHAVPSPTEFSCRFTHVDGVVGTGGSARTASGAELYTAAGVGQSLSGGTVGSGFSYWISGYNAHRVVINPYAESANGPAKFGGRTIVLGGIIECGFAQGYSDFGRYLTGEANLRVLDGNLAKAEPDRGTDLHLWGGASTPQPSSIKFLSHDRSRTTTRWYLRDDPTYYDPSLTIARSNFPGSPRLVLYIPDQVYRILSAERVRTDSTSIVTITLDLDPAEGHAIAFGNHVRILEMGVASSFEGAFIVTGAITDRTFQYEQQGPNEAAPSRTGKAILNPREFAGETHLSGEGSGSVRLNYSSGKGGVRLFNGNELEVATFNVHGQLTRYDSIPTVSRGVIAEYAEREERGRRESIPQSNLYSVPAGRDGLYRVSYYLKVTQAATSDGQVALVVGWTDRDVAGPISIPSQPADNSTGVGGTVAGSHVLDVAAGTAITYETTYSSSGGTPMEYRVTLRVEAL